MPKTPPQWRNFEGAFQMTDTLIIAGSGGHAKVVADIAVLNGYKKIFFLDDDENKLSSSLYHGKIMGNTKDIDKFDGDVFVAIGNGNDRRKLIDYYSQEKGRKVVSLIHPRVVIGSDVIIDDVGVVIMAGAVINTGSRIGKGTIVNTCSSVDHDCIIDSFSHISVGAHLCGNVRIGQDCWIGAGSTIINNISIIDSTIIGAGAVVIDNIIKSGTYVGVPARRITQ